MQQKSKLRKCLRPLLLCKSEQNYMFLNIYKKLCAYFSPEFENRMIAYLDVFYASV